MLGLVRIFLGIVALAGLVHLARQLPPLISARRALQQRMSNSARYSAWRGGAARSPDLLDRTEAEIIGARLQRLALKRCPPAHQYCRAQRDRLAIVGRNGVMPPCLG